MKYLLILFLALGATVANAQLVTTVGQNQDLFQKNLYAADRVMELRNELNLSEAQAAKIKKIHSENAGKFSTMKWDLDDETKKLKALLDESKIDEVAVQKQMDKVLALENSLKKQQLSTMVSIKNELNTEQQEILKNQSLYARHFNDVINKNIIGTAKVGAGLTNNTSGVKIPGISTSSSLHGSNSPRVFLQIAGTGQENAPIYMLEGKNGMEQVKELKDINPEDIKSIEVLKDKSATDVFGEKGKNGVIIIKLKGSKK
ncbi:Spy/CpxP family protein refolding chaperone [Algoriphagus sp. Y33]|uniref:Spy/CpxP family protein refolding chaperone n=1 Tax=Algoriphagus sp. Y33 TaxID=2772483 RepID=UPI001786372D|nr:periplasmic heavy metal sensor [Algoriphagus sp. Y33]